MVKPKLAQYTAMDGLGGVSYGDLRFGQHAWNDAPMCIVGVIMCRNDDQKVKYL